MILQEEFIENGYVDILRGTIASEYDIHLADLFDVENIPEELISIFISKQRDELFILLEAGKDINALCEQWDNHIRVYALIYGQSEVFEKLKYNIVQLIIYNGICPDKSQEGNLIMSRKIMIKGDLRDRAHIQIDNSEAIELPFYMIPEKDFKPNQEKNEYLNELIPKDEKLLAVLGKKTIKKNYIIDKNGISAKTFPENEFNMIKEWLEK